MFSILLCTYRLRRDNIPKGFGDFWELKRGLTRRAMAGIRRFERDTWMGPLLEKREKWRTPGCFSANDSRLERCVGADAR